MFLVITGLDTHLCFRMQPGLVRPQRLSHRLVLKSSGWGGPPEINSMTAGCKSVRYGHANRSLRLGHHQVKT
jgi:hypothetical protein